MKALRITTQKALYFFICIAAAIRGFYFQSSFNESLKWASDLRSAYYPLLLSGSSLVVCLWAEKFHLNDFSAERPFLTKSFCGFILFNVITYSLFITELILIKYLEANALEKTLFLGIFNGIYAALMLIVVIFFLIYGIEVYVKVSSFSNQQNENSLFKCEMHCILCRYSAAYIKLSKKGLVKVFIFSLD